VTALHLLVKSLKIPALLPASTLQLTLNLFDFGGVTRGNSDLTREYRVQHVNECVGRKVHQFSEHAYSPKLRSTFSFAIGLPEVAACKWMKMPVA
jgi:hypothetical protein